MSTCYDDLIGLRHKHGTSELDRAIRQYNKSRLTVDKPEKRKRVPKVWLLEAYARQSGICPRCNAGMDINDCEPDHIQALADGGRNNRFNIRALHRECNRSKGSNSLVKESKLGHGTILEQIS